MNAISRFVTGFLAVVVLFSSTCFAADIHYCENEIQSVAFFDKADPCGNMKKETPKKMSRCCMKRQMKLEQELKGKTTFRKKKCCHNHSVGFKADQGIDHYSVELTQAPTLKLNTFSFYTIEVFPAEQITFQTLKAPPKRQFDTDFQAFYQVFRI